MIVIRPANRKPQVRVRPNEYAPAKSAVDFEKTVEGLRRCGLTYVNIGEAIGVDPDRVRSWVARGNLPRPEYLEALARMLRDAEAMLLEE